VFIIRSCLAAVVVLGAGPALRADFIPWDPSYLTNDSWILFPTTDPNGLPRMHTVNDGDFAVGFDQAKSNNSARGMNALKFSYGGGTAGHLSSTSLAGQFQVQAGGTQEFGSLLILVAIDSNFLPDEFAFSMGGRTFDPSADFGFYDPLFPKTYSAGRPSGYYSVTDPNAEPLSYCFDKGMVTIMGLSGLTLDGSHPLTVDYAFESLPGKAVFSVYGVVAGKDWIYHTNRGMLDLNDSTSAVSTFEVVAEPGVVAIPAL
jgi:hypothetical protein